MPDETVLYREAVAASAERLVDALARLQLEAAPYPPPDEDVSHLQPTVLAGRVRRLRRGPRATGGDA